MKNLFWPTGTGVSHKQKLLFIVIVVHQCFLVKVYNICFHKCLWGLLVCWILNGSKIALNFSKPKNNLKNENTFPMHMVKYLWFTQTYRRKWSSKLVFEWRIFQNSKATFSEVLPSVFQDLHRECWWISCALCTTSCSCHPSLPIWAESIEGCTSAELNWSATADPVITQRHPQGMVTGWLWKVLAYRIIAYLHDFCLIVQCRTDAQT